MWQYVKLSEQVHPYSVTWWERRRRSGQPSVSTLWLDEKVTLICNYHLSVAVCEIVRAGPSLLYDLMRKQLWSAITISMWQYVIDCPSRSIPEMPYACCWDIKQLRNNHLGEHCVLIGFLLLGVRSLRDQGCSGDEWCHLLQLLFAAVELGRQGSADRPHVFSCGFVKGASL